MRLLTVLDAYRGAHVGQLLMLAALEAVEARGGTEVVAIGRVGVLPLYEDAGLLPQGKRIQSGAVEFELLHAPTTLLRERAARFKRSQAALLAGVQWRIQMPLDGVATHGGRSFEALGTRFEHLEKRSEVIGADVLDAPFDPAPGVLSALRENLAWALRTSPPTASEGLVQAIAEARGVKPANIVCGGGSSDLIHLALRHWVTPGSRVLMLDPMYSEYAHVLEALIGCRVERLRLRPEQENALDLQQLAAALQRGYDWVFLVNPNNPTGQHVPRAQLEALLADLDPATRVWVDETYVDFAGRGQSLEPWAAASGNVVVCKSMSKAYALSGVRVGYLCGPEPLLRELRPHVPPWSVGTPGQMAACAALADPSYYEARWREVQMARKDLVAALEGFGWKACGTVGNFVLCSLPEGSPKAKEMVERAARKGLYLRDAAGMGSLGDRTLRIAVLDGPTNRRTVQILRSIMQE